MSDILSEALESLPQILNTNAVMESDDNIKIETNVLDPASFNWTPESSYNTARFQLPKKGTILDSRSHLIFKCNWNQEATLGSDGQQYALPRNCGGLSCIKQCRLYVNGKLVSEQREAGRKLALENECKSYETKTHIDDVLLQSNHRYTQAMDATGDIQLYPDSGRDAYKSRALRSDNWTPEINVNLRSLFPILKDVMLPVSMFKGDVLIEIDFEGKSDEIMVFSRIQPVVGDFSYTIPVGGAITQANLNTRLTALGGIVGTLNYKIGDKIEVKTPPTTAPTGAEIADITVATVDANGKVETVAVGTPGAGYTAGQDIIFETEALAPASDFQVSRPRLLLDYITYNEEKQQALAETTFNGMLLPFRETVLVHKNLPAVADNTPQRKDLELGFSNAQVMKVNIAKIVQVDNPFMKKFRSDLLTSQVHNMVVNNKLIFDRDVNRRSEEYQHLTESMKKPLSCLPGTYEVRGKQADDADDFIVGECKNASSTTNFNGLEDLLQGSMNYLGISLNKTGGSDDKVSNSVRLGANPMVLRLERTSGTDDFSKASVDVNVWVDKIRMGVMENGDFNVRDF